MISGPGNPTGHHLWQGAASFWDPLGAADAAGPAPYAADDDAVAGNGRSVSYGSSLPGEPSLPDESEDAGHLAKRMPRFGARSYTSSCSDATEAGAQLTMEDEDELAGFLDICFPGVKLSDEASTAVAPQDYVYPVRDISEPYMASFHIPSMTTMTPGLANAAGPYFVPNAASVNVKPVSAANAASLLPGTQLLFQHQHQQRQGASSAAKRSLGESASTLARVAKRAKAELASPSSASSSSTSPTLERSPSASSGNSSGEAAQIVYRKLWSEHDDDLLFSLVRKYGKGNWKKLAEFIPGKTATQCSQRWRKALDPDIIKGKWSTEEDNKLREAVDTYGPKWRKIASVIPGRTGKQCRDRYTSRLRPEIRKIGNWTPDEDHLILEAHNRLGNRWAAIQKLIPDRAWYSIKWRIETLRRNASKNENASQAAK